MKNKMLVFTSSILIFLIILFGEKIYILKILSQNSFQLLLSRSNY